MWGAVIQGQTAPVWALFSTAPLVLPGACPSTGFTWGHGLLQASMCSSPGGLLQGLLVDISSPWMSMGCRGTAASPWPSPQAAEESQLWQLLPSVICLSVCRVVPLTYSHLSLLCLQFPFFFISKIYYPRGTTTTVNGLGLSQQQVGLEASWLWFLQTQGGFWQLLKEASPVAHSLLKPCHASPIHCVWVNITVKRERWRV